MNNNEKQVLVNDINRSMRDISNKLSTMSETELLALYDVLAVTDVNSAVSVLKRYKAGLSAEFN